MMPVLEPTRLKDGANGPHPILLHDTLALLGEDGAELCVDCPSTEKTDDDDEQSDEATDGVYE